MITPDEIHEKAKRLYPKFVSAWLERDAEFFPYSIAANKKVSDDYKSAVAARAFDYCRALSLRLEQDRIPRSIVPRVGAELR